MSSKQDLQGARTVAQLEQKYNYDKRFAEIMGVATGARKMAEEVENRFNETMTSEEIFNILTDNGKNQGLFRDDNGDIYVNVNYIQALEEIFTKNITMSGKFTYKTMTYLPPELPELKTLQKHILGIITIPADKLPLYDFNSDGQYNTRDLLKGQSYELDPDSFAAWSGAVKTEVTITIDLKNPQKAFRITGINMWGREIDSYLGIQGVSVKHTETVDYEVEKGTTDDWYYKKWNGGEIELWENITLDEFGGVGNIKCLRKTITLPFAVGTSPIVILTIKDGTSIGCLRGSTTNYSYDYINNTLILEVLNTANSIEDGTTVDVSVLIKGEWK